MSLCVVGFGRETRLPASSTFPFTVAHRVCDAFRRVWRRSCGALDVHRHWAVCVPADGAAVALPAADHVPTLPAARAGISRRHTDSHVIGWLVLLTSHLRPPRPCVLRCGSCSYCLRVRRSRIPRPRHRRFPRSRGYFRGIRSASRRRNPRRIDNTTSVLVTTHCRIPRRGPLGC